MAQGAEELIRHLQAVVRRRHLFIAVALLTMSGFAVYGHRLPRFYKADSTVFIETSVINNLVKGLAVTPDMDERIRVLKYALLSRDIIRRVLADIEPAPRSAEALQERVAALQRRTDIAVRGRDLFTVSIVDSDPRFAQSYINTLVSRYVQESLSGKRSETLAANRFLEEQLQHVKTRLDGAEEAIIAFRRSQGAVSAADEQTALQAIADYRREIESIELSRNALRAKRDRLRDQLEGAGPAAVAAPAAADSRLAALEEERERLLRRYTSDFPEVVRVERELEERRRELQAIPTQMSARRMETPLYRDLQARILEVDAELSALQGRRETLGAFMARREAELKRVPEADGRLALLIQERDAIRRIHEELMLRLNQAEVSEQMGIWDQGTVFRVVDAALLPTRPVSPDMVRWLLLTLAAGIGAGLGAVLLADSLDTRLKGAAEARDLGIPVLAIVPGIVDDLQVRRGRRRDAGLYLLAGLWLSGVVGLLVYEIISG